MAYTLTHTRAMAVLELARERGREEEGERGGEGGGRGREGRGVKGREEKGGEKGGKRRREVGREVEKEGGIETPQQYWILDGAWFIHGVASSKGLARHLSSIPLPLLTDLQV